MVVPGFSIIIDDGFLTLDNFTFEPEVVATPSENARIDKQETFIMCEGIIPAAKYNVAQRALELQAAVSEQIVPRHVEIQFNGATWRDFPPSSNVNSPIITRFRLKSGDGEDGSGDSYWKWEIAIYVLASGRLDGTIDLRTSVEEISFNKQMIRKVWKAEVKASSGDAAKAKVLSFAPSEKRIRADIEKFPQESRATGTWTWDARYKGEIVSYEETVIVRGQGAGYDFDRQVNEAGDAKAILQRKPFSGVTTIVSGTVRGLTPDLPIPEPHFSESDDMVRDFESEETEEKAIPDGEQGVKLGIYRRKYMEVWKSTGDPGTPNHSDHAEIVLTPPPPDGVIADSL